MRAFVALAGGFFLLSGIPCAAAPACKVNVIYQHVPKTSKHFEQVLSKAKRGDRSAQFQAGVAYETGTGVEKDYIEAARWYRTAADLGDPAAQNNLGGLYLRGLGVKQDDAAALQWYLGAASDGFLPAQNNVGFMYSAGRGTRANDEEAVHSMPRSVPQNLRESGSGTNESEL